MDIITVIFWSLVGSVASLAGGVLLLGSEKTRRLIIRYGLPFGAGALLAAAFVNVLPEALETGDVHAVSLAALGGFLGFFILERFLGWFHHHEEDHHHEVANAHASTSHQWLVVIGDGLHKAIDGVAIGAAFLINPAAGIATALAVAAHEVPREIGDFGILLGKGMKPLRVVAVSLISASGGVITAVATYLIGGAAELNPALLLAVAAGFFIYVAASDIIPEIHEKPHIEANRQAFVLLLGVVAISAFVSLVPHSHSEGSVDHPTDHSGSSTHTE